jgi:aspartate beta-hydroxylase
MEIAKTDFIETELKKFETDFEITEAGLITLRDSFKDLKVKGVDDKEGLKAVETARKTLKKQRVTITNASKMLRDSAVRFQKAVIERENHLVNIIEPMEDALGVMEDEIYEEKEKIRLEAEKKESARIQSMLDRLNAVNYAMDFHTLKEIADFQFEQILSEATAAFEESERVKEMERIDREEKEKEELAEGLRQKALFEQQQKELREQQEAFWLEQEKIKKANEDQAAKLKAEQDKLDAEKKAIEDAKEKERLEKVRQEELELAKKQAAEKAKIEAEAKAKREAEDKIESERKAKEEAEEKLLLSSDKDKFAWLADTLNDALIGDNVMIWTHFKSKKGKEISKVIRELLKQAFRAATENK